MQNTDKQRRTKDLAGFGERMNTAAAARKQMLEKWQAAKADVNDPAFQERQAARLAAAAARDERDAQRKAAKDALKAQAIADRKADLLRAEAQAAADLADRQARETEAANALIALRDQRKSARDARYAARKARQ